MGASDDDLSLERFRHVRRRLARFILPVLSLLA